MSRNPWRTDLLLVFAAVKKMAPSPRGAVSGPEVPDACVLFGVSWQAGTQGLQAPKVGRQAEANEYEHKKTPRHQHTHTPAHRYGYPRIRQNSWFQILTFEIKAQN